MSEIINLFGKECTLNDEGNLLVPSHLLTNKQWVNDLQFFRAQHNLLFGEWKHDRDLDCWFVFVPESDRLLLSEAAQEQVKKV